MEIVFTGTGINNLTETKRKLQFYEISIQMSIVQIMLKLGHQGIVQDPLAKSQPLQQGKNTPLLSEERQPFNTTPKMLFIWNVYSLPSSKCSLSGLQQIHKLTI